MKICDTTRRRPSPGTGASHLIREGSSREGRGAHGCANPSWQARAPQLPGPKDPLRWHGACASRGAPATPRPASARGRRRSAPHRRWRDTGTQNGRVVTTAVWAPVRPETRWMRVVSMASARLIAGKMVVRRRANIDFPAPGGPKRSTLWSERRHRVQLRFSTAERTRAVVQDPTAGPGGVGKPCLELSHGTSALGGVAAVQGIRT
jgi:hypothetical protein